MIVFRLKCSMDHDFEGWFRNAKDFERQKRNKLLVCPMCGDHKVAKILTSAVSIKSKDNGIKSLFSSTQGFKMKLLREISQQVRNNFENVGEMFPEEARKIHYGETEKRNIYGRTTPDEEKMLKEEGIEFFKIPMLAETDD